MRRGCYVRPVWAYSSSGYDPAWHRRGAGLGLRGSDRRPVALPRCQFRLQDLGARLHPARLGGQAPTTGQAHKQIGLGHLARGGDRARERPDGPRARLRRVPAPLDRRREEGPRSLPSPPAGAPSPCCAARSLTTPSAAGPPRPRQAPRTTETLERPDKEGSHHASAKAVA